jgi:hypothetical protein
MSNLATVLTSLHACLLETPRLRLLRTMDQFDAHSHPLDDQELYRYGTEGEDEVYELAMRNLRRNFPLIYQQALLEYQRTHNLWTVEAYVSQRLEAIHLPNCDFETLACGYIPIMLFGISLWDCESWENHPDVAQLVRFLDPEAPEEFNDHYDVPNRLYEACYYLLDSLDHKKDVEIYRELYTYLTWLVSASNNVVIDWSPSDDEGIEPGVWDDPGDIAVAQQVYEEADWMLDHIRNTAHRLTAENAPLLAELTRNIHKTLAHIETVGPTQHAKERARTKLRLRWQTQSKA